MLIYQRIVQTCPSRPDWAQPPYQILDTYTKFQGGQREWKVNDSLTRDVRRPPKPSAEPRQRMLQKKKSGPPPFLPSNWDEQKSGGSYSSDPPLTPLRCEMSHRLHGIWPIRIPNALLLRSRPNSRFCLSSTVVITELGCGFLQC